MNTKKINGQVLEKMLRNGLGAIQSEEQKVNDLNVFPVPDGDTGTNMKLTLEGGISRASTTTETGAYLKQLSEGMLLGARGNSGVILSQIFKGIFLELQHAGTINANDMLNAFVRGYKQAYASVVRPVEGTVLTVCREGAENIRSQVDRNTTFETMLSSYIGEMKKSLARTPDILPVLKEAGVIDSGGLGYIIIVEGMLKFLCGEVIEMKESSAPAPGQSAAGLDESLFNENSEFEDGYCTEFILQLMKGPRYDQRFKTETFIEDLQVYGNSLVVIRDGYRVKVHVHTMKPAKVIKLAQEYGEFLTMKIENMQIQHNEHIRMNKKKVEHKSLAITAVANGSGMSEIFSGFGCDYVLDGGVTMNTSAEEFLAAFNELDAEHIAVLPNNKNVILAAEQAAGMYKGPSQIHVLHSRSMVEGYYAMAMDVPDSDDIDYRLDQLQTGVDIVTTVSVTTATRDYSANGVSCREGESIGLLDGELVCATDSGEKAVVGALKSMEEIYDKEVCIVFTGENVTESMCERLEDRITDAFPNLEVSFMEGKQHIYPWLIGVL